MTNLNDTPGIVITGPTRLILMPIEGNAEQRCARLGLDVDVPRLVRLQELRDQGDGPCPKWSTLLGVVRR